jgi:glycosyltransferase involved in cell wall biosynthesis
LQRSSHYPYFRRVKPERPIVLVGPAYPLRGGIANFNESLCETLMAMGEDCQIVSFYMQYPKFVFPGKTQNAEGDPPKNLTVHPWLSSTNPQSWVKAAHKIIALNPRFVAIRFWLPQMGPAQGTLARILQKHGIPVIGLVDNAIPHEPRPFDKSLSWWFFRHCDAFFTLSQSVARDLETLAPGRPSHTHPHPVYDVFGPAVCKSEARKALGISGDKSYVLFFGFVRRYKGLDLLIEAFGDSRLKDLDVHLIIAGEFYEPKTDFTDQIERLDISDRVAIFDQYIPQESVKNYFCAANLVAQTYRTATQSGVTQIAYHFGRPMLVTDVGGLAEIVPDGKVGYVTQKDPKSIADAVVRFFAENKEPEFAKAVEREKERFSWTHFAEEFTKFGDGVHPSKKKKV